MLSKFHSHTALRIHPWTASYRRAPAAVVVLAASAIVLGAQSLSFADEAPTCFGEAATITGSGTIDGTEADDVIVGSDLDDVIDGLGGDDRICGLGGSDQLMGGLGNDKLDAGPGDDFMRGDVFNPAGHAVGGGDDWLYGSDGVDRAAGDSVGATASGGGNDRMFGGDGDDDIFVGDSIAFVGDATGAGDDVIRGGLGNDAINGDSTAFEGNAISSGGDDVVDLGTDGGFFALGDHNIGNPTTGTAIGAGDDKVIGGSASDILVGDSSSPDTSVTEAGDDVIKGRGGNDTLFGDNSNFDLTITVSAVGGEDRLDGGEGDDTLRAGPGNDDLNGGKDTDDCDGEAGTGDKAKHCEVVAGTP